MVLLLSISIGYLLPIEKYHLVFKNKNTIDLFLVLILDLMTLLNSIFSSSRLLG